MLVEKAEFGEFQASVEQHELERAQAGPTLVSPSVGWYTTTDVSVIVNVPSSNTPI